METGKQRLVAQKFEQKARTGDVMIKEKTTFGGLMLVPEVLEGLSGAGFAVPSPIQLQAIPLGRAGLDLIVQAKSGTGKTCVFTVIALESIDVENSCMQVVVLAPTREIAVQIWEVIKTIGCAMEKLRCYAFIGGLNINDDKLKLKKCHIAVATPGRFRQLIELDAANVNSVRLFVLDEADKLLEAGFQDDINWIYSALPMNKQMIAASATYPEYLAQQLTTYMRSPKMIRLNACDPALLGISQYYVLLPFSPTPYKVYEQKSEFLLKLFSSVEFQQCLVFSNYQSRAQSLSKLLDSKGWQSTYICGSQEQEKRLTAMAKLRHYQCRVLISTDLTSRGIDVENVDLVVNLDLPADHETYLHRIGRAGRYGSFGAAVTLVTQGRESADLRIIETRCQTLIHLLPDPIPKDLTHSCAKLDLDVEVTVEEALRTSPSPDCLPVVSCQEAEKNICIHDTSDVEISKWAEQELPLNHAAGYGDHTTGQEDNTNEHEGHTTGLEDHMAGQKDDATEHEDHTTGLEDHMAGQKDNSTEHEDHTTGLEVHKNGREDHTIEPGDHPAEYDDHETAQDDHTIGLDESSVGSSANEETTPGIIKKTQGVLVAVNGTPNVDSPRAFSMQHEDTSNTSKGIALDVDMTQQEHPSKFRSGVNNTKSGGYYQKGFHAVDLNGIDTFCTDISALIENEIDSVKAADVNSDRSCVMPGNDAFDIAKGVENTKIISSEKEEIAPDSLATAIQPRGNNHAKHDHNLHSFIKEITPVSEQIRSLGELVSLNKSYVDGSVESFSSSSLDAEEDLVAPSDESIFEDVERLIACSDRSYTTMFPFSAKLLGEMLDVDGMMSIPPEEQRISPSNGDAVLCNLSVEQQCLSNIEIRAVQTSGAAYQQNLSGGECLPKKESQAAERPVQLKQAERTAVVKAAGGGTAEVQVAERNLELKTTEWTVKTKQTSSDQCSPKKERQAVETTIEKDLQLEHNNSNMSTETTYQETKPSKQGVRWTREQLMGMERLAHNIIIEPELVKLVHELCINRGCEYPDAWENPRRGNATGRPGTKFGGRKANYSSNRKEPMTNYYGATKAGSPSVSSIDSIDSTHAMSSYSIVEAAKASTPLVSTNVTSTLISSSDSVGSNCTVPLTSSFNSTNTADSSIHSVQAGTVEIGNATPRSSDSTKKSTSLATPSVGCIDTKSTATWYSSLQDTSDISSKTSSGQNYGVSQELEICRTVVENTEIKSPSSFPKSNQTTPATIWGETPTAASSYPLSKTWTTLQICDEPPSFSKLITGKRSTEPDCSPLMPVSLPKHENSQVILEGSAGTDLPLSVCNDHADIPATEQSVYRNHFQEAICNGKFSEIPYDTLPRQQPFLESPQGCFQVVDEDQSLGRDYMLKLSACKDPVESFSSSSDAPLTAHDDFGDIYWKPSAKQTRRKSHTEKNERTSTRERTKARDRATQKQQTKENRQSCHTTKVQNNAGQECWTSHDFAGMHDAHSNRKHHDDFTQEQQFRGWTHNGETHSHHDSASIRKAGRKSEKVGHSSSPQQSFPGYANPDAYSSYYWTSYTAHLQNAEYFRQLLESMADQSRLQDIAVQQAAYIQHMIAFQRKL